MAEIKMTQEVREQLAGLLPMTGDATYQFTPDVFEQVDEKFRPSFTIRQLSNEQVLTVKQMMLEEERTVGKTRKPETVMKDMVRKNEVYMDITFQVLKGWSNLYDLGTGELVDYDGKKETMLALPEAILTDIFTEAMRITGFLPHGVL